MYRENNKPYSNSSIEWLQLVSFQTKSNSKHAQLYGGEKVIFDPLLGENYLFNRFCVDTNTVYEFITAAPCALIWTVKILITEGQR